MRLIDADALISKIEEHMPLSWTDSESELQAVSDYHTYLTTISTAATIDAVPVVCGELKICDDGFLRCTSCNYPLRLPLVSIREVNFCWYCGAKMEVKE